VNKDLALWLGMAIILTKHISCNVLWNECVNIEMLFNAHEADLRTSSQFIVFKIFVCGVIWVSAEINPQILQFQNVSRIFLFDLQGTGFVVSFTVEFVLKSFWAGTLSDSCLSVWTLL
jgi:hypothetical protein